MNPPAKTIKVMIADDHQLFMQGVESLLAPVNHIVLVDKLPDADCLLQAVINTDHQLDVVIIDLSMPGLKTESLIDEVLKYSNSIRMIALTMHADAHLAHRLLGRGLSGYVLKDSAFDDLVQAIDSVMTGSVFISSILADEVQQIETELPVEYLTKREESVLTEVALGLSNKEIAKKLDISERTVRFHLENCCEKLGTHGRTEAVNVARSRKLIAN